MAKLNANTIVVKGYEPVSLYAGDEVPEWAADQIGDHLIAADDAEPDEPAAARPRGRKPAQD